MRALPAMVLAVALFGSSHALAQGSPQAPPVLSPDAPLTLRPSADVLRLASAVARTLALRLSVAVSVSEPPPAGIPEAVPVGHLAMARAERAIHLVLAGPEGQIYRSEVSVGGDDGQAAVRAVALAIEALRDAALDGPPEGAIATSTRRTFERSGHTVTWIYQEREGGLFGPPRPPEAEAKPSFCLGAVGGLATERLTAMVGPRVGLALCLHGTCLALEGDVPVMPQESVGCDGRRIQYRPITIGLRFTIRPLSIDDIVHFAFSLGIISRIGLANLVGVEVSRLSTDFGIRSAIEVSWRFAPPVEIGLEVGADVHVSPARFIRTTRPRPGVSCPTIEAVLVEDLVTLWAALVVRVRP